MNILALFCYRWPILWGWLWGDRGSMCKL